MAENEFEKLLEELEESSNSSQSSKDSDVEHESKQNEVNVVQNQKRSFDEEKIRGLLKKLRDNIEFKKKELLQKEVELAITKYPEAAEFKDELKNYLAKGLSAEEAVGAILAKKGKLFDIDVSNKIHGKTPPLVEIEKPKEKKIEEMTPEEKLEKLKELESKGEISLY